MHPVAHARLGTVVAVLVAGMGGGHLLMPHGAAGSALRGAAFYGLMLLVGAWRGWRESEVARAESPGPARISAAARAALYAAAAVLLAIAGYVAMHGG